MIHITASSHLLDYHLNHLCLIGLAGFPATRVQVALFTSLVENQVQLIYKVKCKCIFVLMRKSGDWRA